MNKTLNVAILASRVYSHCSVNTKFISLQHWVLY